jgi:hypothetical protein
MRNRGNAHVSNAQQPHRDRRSHVPVDVGPAEMFKIEKGKICRIEAILERAPYGMNS